MMKTKRFEIKKQTIVNLTQTSLNLAKGGTKPTGQTGYEIEICIETNVCTTIDIRHGCYACQ